MDEQTSTTTPIVDIIRKAGLTESQAKGYLALIEHGMLTPTELADHTSESRTNAYMICEKLEKLGGNVSYHDPYVPNIVLENGERMSSIPLTEETVKSSDCVVIVTDHRNVDYKWVAERAPLIVDSRNATRDLKKTALAERIIRL